MVVRVRVGVSFIIAENSWDLEAATSCAGVTCTGLECCGWLCHLKAELELRGSVAQWLGRLTCDWRSRVQSQPLHYRVRPLTSCFTHICLSHQAVQFDTSLGVNRHTV